MVTKLYSDAIPNSASPAFSHPGPQQITTILPYNTEMRGIIQKTVQVVLTLFNRTTRGSNETLSLEA